MAEQVRGVLTVQGLRDMLPCVAVNHCRNCTLRDPKLGAQHTKRSVSCSVQPSNLHHTRFCQFGGSHGRTVPNPTGQRRGSLIYVPPATVSNNRVNQAATDTEHLRQALPLLTVCKALAYFLNLLSGQHRSSLAFTAWHALRTLSHSVSVASQTAPFGSHISHVISVRSEKEMVRTYASRRVTIMADKHSCRYRSSRPFPSEAMRFHMAASCRQHKLPVTTDVMGALPVPAGISFSNMGPKTLLNGTFWPSRHVSSTCLLVVGIL